MTLPAELRAEAERLTNWSSNPNSPNLMPMHDHQTQALLHRAADALEWRPIASAPDDGRDILVYWHDDCVDHHRVVFRSCTNEWSDGISLYTEPTHWLPLPATPEGEHE